MKELFENLRKYVNEKEEGKKENICLFVEDDGGDVLFVLYEKEMAELSITNAVNRYGEDSVTDRNLEKNNAILGKIAISQPDSPCMGAWEVKGSMIPKKYRAKGNAKLLYGLAQAYIYPAPLMADRGEVNKSARRVWKSMDLQKGQKQFPSNKKPYIGKFDNVFEPVTEPEEDDCEGHEIRSAPELDRAYASNAYASELKVMMKKSKKFITYIDKKYPDVEIYYLMSGIDIFPFG